MLQSCSCPIPSCQYSLLSELVLLLSIALVFYVRLVISFVHLQLIKDVVSFKKPEQIVITFYDFIVTKFAYSQL